MLLGALEKLLRVAAAALVVAIVVLVGAQIVFRYAVEEPIIWSEQATTLCYQWLSFLGSALAVRYRAHYGVDFVVRLVGPRCRAWIAWLEHLVIWALALFMVVYGSRIVQSSALQMYPTLPFSVGTGYLILPISGVLFVLMDWAVLLERRAGRAA